MYVFDQWKLILMASSAQSEATSLTKVALARVRASRLLDMLEISEAYRDPDVAALAKASDMVVRYDSKRSSVSSGMLGGRS